MSDPLFDLANWLLYARLTYFGSHWSANILLAIPGVLIFYKMLKIRWGETNKLKPKWFWIPKLTLFVLIDGFFVVYFPGSFHEEIFEPLFVAVTVAFGQTQLSVYAYHWAHDINIWRSLYIEWSTTTILGFAWFWKYMQIRLKWWLPFLIVIAVWSASGLQVSLPFPSEDSPYCHDCVWPNLMEFLYNLTFAIGIVPSFKGTIVSKANLIRLRDSAVFLLVLGVGLSILLIWLVSLSV